MAKVVEMASGFRTMPKGHELIRIVSALVPHPLPTGALPDDAWEVMARLLAPIGFASLCDVPQDPVFHGEGDVMRHTRMVCDSLCRDWEESLSRGHGREALLLAAALHDIGKLRTTREEDGRWHAPNHSPVGSRMVREFLWRDCGLAGDDALRDLRETVCALVRHHMLPAHLVDRDDAERKTREVAATGRLARGFSWRALCLLGKADVMGRKADDMREMLEQVELARMVADESGCLDAPYPFADAHTEHAYLTGHGVSPDASLYDDTWGEVTLMCGLAGTGKDTWVRRNIPEMPMVSLDDIRQEMGVSPSDNQGRIIQEAQERARGFLRQRQPFVWNATSLTRRSRQRVTSLAERYGARVRIVFLETGWETGLARNANRDAKVPEAAIRRMLAKLEPPTPDEAQTVEWRTM